MTTPALEVLDQVEARLDTLAEELAPITRLAESRQHNESGRRLERINRELDAVDADLAAVQRAVNEAEAARL